MFPAIYAYKIKFCIKQYRTVLHVARLKIELSYMHNSAQSVSCNKYHIFSSFNDSMLCSSSIFFNLYHSRANSAQGKLIFFVFFLENLHLMSKPILRKKIRNLFQMLSAEFFTQRV